MQQGDYQVNTENLIAVFEFINGQLPFGFQLDWQDTVRTLELAIAFSEPIECKSLLTNCYLYFFIMASTGDVAVDAVTFGKHRGVGKVVAKTFVGEFLEAVDG